MRRSNEEIIQALRELAELEKLDEGSAQAFRVRAYDKAIDAIRTAGVDVAELGLDELKAIEGIGDHTARRIREFVETGHIGKLDRLRQKYPPGLLELMRIPGVGPKTVLLLWRRLGVETIEDLQRAIEEHRIQELPRMSAKTEQKIGKAIERLGLHGEEHRTPIADALPLAEDIVAALGGLPAVDRVEYAGSLRRFRETIGDLDIIVASADPASVMEAFVGLPLVAEVIVQGETKTSIVTTTRMQVDVRVVGADQYGAALLYFTGSKAHNIHLRQLALEHGWTLNEYALSETDGGEVVASSTEEDIYAALDLPPILPPLREDRGEIEAGLAGTLPKVVAVDDIVGDLHVHSAWSGDGRSTLEEMVAAAVERGLEYVAITDHAENLTINGLSRDEVLQQRARIEDLRERYPDLTILHGSELNIGKDGSLDYDAEFLMAFDWCVASVHSSFDLPRDQQTARIVAAMRHRAVDAIGHLTGRRIGIRPGIELDLDEVFDVAAETGTAIEINSHLDRLDVSADVLFSIRDRDDVVFVIDTDAHHVSELANIRWGVRNAQRGWVPASRVLNTFPRERFLAWGKRARPVNKA